MSVRRFFCHRFGFRLWLRFGLDLRRRQRLSRKVYRRRCEGKRLRRSFRWEVGSGDRSQGACWKGRRVEQQGCRFAGGCLGWSRSRRRRDSVHGHTCTYQLVMVGSMSISHFPLVLHSNRISLIGFLNFNRILIGFLTFHWN